jgi:hypothetical protein
MRRVRASAIRDGADGMRFLLTIIACILLFGPIPILVLGGISLGALVSLCTSHPIFVVAAVMFVLAQITGALAKAVTPKR